MNRKPEGEFGRNEEKELIYGRNPVLEALLSGQSVDTVYIQKGSTGLGRVISAAKESGAAVKEISEEKLSSMTGGKHGGTAAMLSAIPYSTLEDILMVSEEKGTDPFIIIADEIQDPHNLGAIIRTAEAAGADGVIIPKRRGAGLTSTVFKTSAGAAGWIKVARVPNIPAAIRRLQEKNIWVYGAEADGEPFYEADLSGGVALVIGSEGQGLGRLVRESCDKILSIDMYGNINSLNASVSAGILMYQIVQFRRGKEGKKHGG